MISSPISLVVRSRSGESIRKVSASSTIASRLSRSNGAFLAGLQQAAQHFLPLELLAAAVFLHHHVGDFVDALIGGKALVASLALAAAADGIGFFALA